ncbi:hypothetical protein K0B04_01565 [Patescibacteria group bacterium]|nr:hypothetical protein [Patescibacteria group bacterium]
MKTDDPRFLLVYLCYSIFLFTAGMFVVTILLVGLRVATMEDIYVAISEELLKIPKTKELGQNDLLEGSIIHPPIVIGASLTEDLSQEIAIPILADKESYESYASLLYMGTNLSSLENPYDLKGVKFDSSDPITIDWYTKAGEQVTMTFEPIIPYGGPDDYYPGTGRAGVFADEIGNITVNPHSGCLPTDNLADPYKLLEAEKLREYIEGGSCSDILAERNQTPEKTNENINNLIGTEVTITQSNKSTKLVVTAIGVITYENLHLVKSMSPTELAGLIGKELTTRSVVIVTSGWDTNYEYIWFSRERWILVMEM